MTDLIVVAAEGGGREGLDLVLPETAELVGGALAFLLVAVLLGRFAWPRIERTVREREGQVQKSLEDAENAKAEAERAKKEYEEQLADARGEANRIIEDGRRQAEEVRKDLIAKAEKDAEAVVARASEQIEAERRRTVQELQAQVADLSIELAEKVVGRSLDGSTQRDLVDAYINEVGALRSDGGRQN